MYGVVLYMIICVCVHVLDVRVGEKGGKQVSFGDMG